MSESKETISAHATEANGKASDQASLSKDQSSLETLQKRIQELESQVSDKEKKYVYLYAEFDNFKKRSAKERTELLKFGWESFARELLYTVDNLERALAHTSPETDKTLVEGLNLVLSQFKSTLKKHGIEEVEALQKDFDPNLHEAVGQEASSLPEGKIVKEHSRGYTLHGRLLRPSRVAISSGPAGDPAQNTTDSVGN